MLLDVEGGEKDIFGEDERRGSDGVRARELERRGWSCARPNEKASFAGSVISLTRMKARKYVTSMPRPQPKCCSVWPRCASLTLNTVLESHKRSHLS